MTSCAYNHPHSWRGAASAIHLLGALEGSSRSNGDEMRDAKPMQSWQVHTTTSLLHMHGVLQTVLSHLAYTASVPTLHAAPTVPCMAT